MFVAFISFSQAIENKDFQAIKVVMAAQEEAWNRGDIDAFMEYYWKSPNLQFIGSKGPTYGWENTLKRYKSTYSSRELMGKLQFDILNIDRRSSDVITVVGKFTLIRQSDQPTGHFLLVFQKIGKKWLIVADHTS